MSEEDSASKEHEPSQHKLNEARKKGEVPRSTDLTTAAGYTGLVLVLMAFGGATLGGAGQALKVLLDQPAELSDLFFGAAPAPVAGVLLAAITPLAPWFAIPAVAALLSVLAQQSFIVTPDKLSPKLSRISILSNAKNKFGRKGLFEFFKSLTKLTIYSAILGLFLAAWLPDIIATLHLSPGMVTAFLGQVSGQFLALVLLVSICIGVIDMLFQQQEHLRKNRMSRKEMMDELKMTEGDPHMKQQRRQRAQEIALNQMLTDVPDADVVIVNPTHYAVALKWSRLPGEAPVCVAKGVDEIAAKIREVANENGVPIHRDPPTARALYASVDLGQEIPGTQYRAVAAAIKFAEAMRRRAKRGLR